MSTDNDSDMTMKEATGPSRREFLSRAGYLAGGLAILGLPGITPRAAAAATTDTRTFVSGVSALELDGQFIDYLRSAEGGFPRADVITAPGPTPIAKKHLGQPRFQDIVIQCDPSMPKPLFDWIAATLAMNLIRKNGAIITADFNHAEQSRLQFNNALVTEFTIPAMDAASKEAASFTIKLTPESTVALGGKGAMLPATAAKSKALSPANFRLTIPGLDCSRVSKIDALSIKQTTSQSAGGEKRDFAKEPGKLEFPNVTLYVAEAQAGTFYSWFQDMVIKGKAGEESEKAGTLEFLDPTLKTSLFTVYLHHLGIFGFSPEKMAAGADGIRKVKVELYCEQITITPINT